MGHSHPRGPQRQLCVSKTAERASKEAETASITAGTGRASEAAERALGYLGVLQRRQGEPWEAGREGGQKR